MNEDVKPKSNLHYFYSGKSLFFVSLLFLITLFSSHFISVTNGVSVEIDVRVSNELELRNAINDPDRVHCNIGLDDIVLEKSLEIPAGKSFVFVGGVLIGGDGVDAIVVKSGGKLSLVGVKVTHVEGEKGRGVYVERGGEFMMWYSSIVGNTVTGKGGGVYNAGVFAMYEESRIFDNTAIKGGGVYNIGTFNSDNKLIYRNTALSGEGDDIFIEESGGMQPYLLLTGIAAVVVVAATVLLFYRSKKRKQLTTETLIESV